MGLGGYFNAKALHRGVVDEPGLLQDGLLSFLVPFLQGSGAHSQLGGQCAGAMLHSCWSAQGAMGGQTCVLGWLPAGHTLLCGAEGVNMGHQVSASLCCPQVGLSWADAVQARGVCDGYCTACTPEA